MVGARLYIITQISTYSYMFRPCILAIVRLSDNICLYDNIQLYSVHIFNTFFSGCIIDQHKRDDSSQNSCETLYSDT
jgi:hypothetical protein